MNSYVIVRGLPAAGKSTVGAGLASHSSLPLFDKDGFLEALFSRSVPGDPIERRSLSNRADRALERAVRESPQAIVVSWWKHPDSAADSGTPTAWLRDLRGSLVEVYCESTPRAAAERFLSRKRHPGHMDERWAYEELLAQLTEAARLGPLNVGPLVSVNAYEPVDFGGLWERVQNASRASNYGLHGTAASRSEG
jgi:hypothetical protein